MELLMLTFFVATAFAANECATNNELLKSNGDKYALKYSSESDKFARTPIGFNESAHDTKDQANREYLITGENTTFMIKGNAKRNGFQIFSEDGNLILSSNLTWFGDNGYYMYRTEGHDWSKNYTKQTFFAFDTKNRLVHDPHNMGLQHTIPLTVVQMMKNTMIRRDESPQEIKDSRFCFLKIEKTIVEKGFGFFKDLFKEPIEEVFPGVHKAFKDSNTTWTEELKNKVFDSAQNELQVQLTKAMKSKSTELMKDLKSKIVMLQDPEKRQEMFEIYIKGQSGEEDKDKKDGETQEKNALLLQQQQDQPQQSPTEEAQQQQLEPQKPQQQQNDIIPPKKEDPGSSVQTAFALCSLALLLFVTW